MLLPSFFNTKTNIKYTSINISISLQQDTVENYVASTVKYFTVLKKAEKSQILVDCMKTLKLQFKGQNRSSFVVSSCFRV